MKGFKTEGVALKNMNQRGSGNYSISARIEREKKTPRQFIVMPVINLANFIWSLAKKETKTL